ncbi:unnamed protein product [Calypogeia fissa]
MTYDVPTLCLSCAYQMITKVRRLGLGLFPAEKEVNPEEKKPPDDIDSHSNDQNGVHLFLNSGSQPPQPFEFLEAEGKTKSPQSAPISHWPEFIEPAERKPTRRSSRKSYGLQLFEAAVREDAQRREREETEVQCEFIESESESEHEDSLLRSSRTPFIRESLENGAKSSFNRISRNGSSQKPPFYETHSRTETQTRSGHHREQYGHRQRSEEFFGNGHHYAEEYTEEYADEYVEEYADEDAEELCLKPGERFFTDEDRIKLVQKKVPFRSVKRVERGEFYIVIIPKKTMTIMPKPPNSYVTPPSEPSFYIRVIMVHMSSPSSVDAALNWLMGDGDEETRCILGLKCELSTDRELKLIQLSLHRRCVLIRVLGPTGAPPHLSSSNSVVFYSPRLAKLLATYDIVKTGTEIEDDVLAIYWTTGLVVNSFKNVAEVYMHRQRPIPMLSIFSKLYKWEWTQRTEISKSDWGRSELSSKQIKYGIMNGWSSRMVALEGAAAVEGATTLMSLENLPRQVVDLFGRAIADAFKTEESSLHETSGTLSETKDPGTLQLTQHSFRSRVKGRSVVELQLKDGQGSAQYKVKSRKGKAVILTPFESSGKHKHTAGAERSREHASNQVAIGAIQSLTILEETKRQANWQSKRLWEGLRIILRDPTACPKHLLLALGCSVGKARCSTANGGSGSENLMVLTKGLDLRLEPFTSISRHLNDSQREAWGNILTSPLSATIGPPGTGKTSLIQSVAKSWIAARREENSKEVLICTAYQNVAVRHLAETLVDGEVSGVLLLISEDYYAGWHEAFYGHLSDCLVVSSSDQCEISMNLTCWRSRNDGREFPNVVVCTVDLIGCPSFAKSLMRGKVTALIIDESSQASDCSFLRPLISLPDLDMVSVLGDPHQLPPYTAVRSDDIVPSVFDLVSNCCNVNFLREQYRMPPSICEFLSAELYDNVLMTAPHRLKEKDIKPLVWSHVKGVSAIAPGKTSLHNVAEANSIVRFCTSLVRTMKVDCERVVVLTLYEEQTRRISDELAASDLTIPVHNVDSFQGQQCDIVIISLVVGRSFSSFAADQRRACVMLSRVRRLLCVFGDFDEVRKNHQAGLWMKLANHCKKQNLVIDEDKLECYLAATVEEANDMWVPRQDKAAHVELLSHDATAAAQEPPAGISVQVIFKAR